MKKSKFILSTLILIVVIVLNGNLVLAQTPQYYNYQILEHNNSFPFGVTTGKGVQWLFTAGNLNQPGLVRSGAITTVYFYMENTSAYTGFWNLTVKLGQSSIVNLPTGVLYTGSLDTVYFRSYVNLVSSTNHWMGITLDHPFVFDSSKSLIVDVSQCGATNDLLWVCQHTYTGIKRTYYDYTPYAYRGQDSIAANFGVDIAIIIGIPQIRNNAPKVYSLEQNYPNPFNPATTISYSIPKAGNVKITVFDVLGRELYVLVNEFKKPGSYSVDFDASELSSGVYFYRIEAGDFRDVKKMILVK
ncbi:MAG: T9SS type A sorting domain-containing protein [Ignavibacteria bacterium]|jgi:hypothetical protein